MASTVFTETTDPGPGYPYLHKRTDIELAASDFEAAATTDTVSLEEYLDYTNAIRIQHASVRVGQYFTGGTVSAAVLDVGKNGGDTDGYIDALNVFDTTTIGADVGVRGALLDGQGSEEGFQSSPNIEALLTLTGDNCADLEAGKATITVWYEELK